MAVDNDEDFQEWVLPDFEDHNPADKGESDLFGKPANWYNSQQDAVEEVVDEKPQPLTLDDIEEIRASAYEDGFNEGKEAGFSQGLEEGKLQGLGEGHEEGRAQGIEQGTIEGKVKVEAERLHWEQLVSRLNRPLEKLDASVEFQLVKLSTSLAEQMTRCEVTVNPQVILQALKQAIEALPVNDQTIVISLNPDDIEFVSNAFSTSECEKRGWDIRSEPTLLRGDCHVQTQTSSIDYTFSTRVNQVLKHFLKENYQNTPDVKDDGDISNDQPLDYEMASESDLQEKIKEESNISMISSDNDTQEENSSTNSDGLGKVEPDTNTVVE